MAWPQSRYIRMGINMNKQLLTIAFVLLACVSFAQSNYHSPYDPGAVRKTDQALRLDTTNASISNNLDVAGDVGAATVNGVVPLTINTVATITVDSQVGVVTSATGTATYAIHGKLMFISVTSKVTDSGTGSGFLRLWLPGSKTASARSFLSAYDIGNGKAAIAYVNTSGGIIYVIQPDYTTTLVANGAEVVVTGWIPIN